MISKKKRILIGVLAIALLLYGMDDLSVWLGVPSRPEFSTFTITRFYRINEKFNKFSLEPQPTLDERCVNALFPHSGSRPCWYVSRHLVEIIAVN